MKKIFLSLVLLLFVFSAFSGHYLYHFSNGSFLPNIDTTLNKINVYRFENAKDSVLYEVIKYDGVGRISSCMDLVDGKKINQKEDLQYVSNTDIVLSKNQTVYNFDNNKSSVTIDAYEYDSLGRKTVHYNFDKDTSYISVEKFTYYNNLISKIYQNNNSNMYYVKKVLLYDNLNRLIKEDAYNANKILMYSETYEYNGNSVSHYLINKDGKSLKETRIYSSNLLKKEIIYRANDNIQSENGAIKIKFLNYEINYNYTNNRLDEMDITYEDNSTSKIRLYYIPKTK